MREEGTRMSIIDGECRTTSESVGGTCMLDNDCQLLNPSIYMRGGTVLLDLLQHTNTAIRNKRSQSRRVEPCLTPLRSVTALLPTTSIISIRMIDSPRTLSANGSKQTVCLWVLNANCTPQVVAS